MLPCPKLYVADTSKRWASGKRFPFVVDGSVKVFSEPSSNTYRASITELQNFQQVKGVAAISRRQRLTLSGETGIQMPDQCHRQLTSEPRCQRNNHNPILSTGPLSVTATPTAVGPIGCTRGWKPTPCRRIWWASRRAMASCPSALSRCSATGKSCPARPTSATT